MDTLFKHFILTRFNVIDSETYRASSYDYVNSDEYLSQRFQLFETYCLPSIINQSNKNFTWLLLFNDQLPEKWRKKLNEFQKICLNIEVCFMREFPKGKQRDLLNQLIINELKRLEVKPEYIMTTRFDNDDAFHFSFVDSVQQYFLEQPKEMLINYANGLQYVPQYNVLKNIRVINGHFGTLVEKNNGNIRTVASFSHNPLPTDLPPAESLKIKKRIWLETVHNSNEFNEAWFRPRYFFQDFFLMGFKYKNLNDFGIKQDIPRFNIYVWKVFFEYLGRKFKKKVIGKLVRKK